MISTVFFLLLVAFQLWYLTSPQVKLQPAGYQVYVTRNPQNARIAGGALLAIAAVLFVLKFGPLTGLCAWVVGLMGVGSLSVTLSPFRYLSIYSTLILYIVFLGLELAF